MSVDQRVSVVIATLGGGELTSTIEQINRGSVTPAEILICIPEAVASRVAKLTASNVKVVRTACRGQVAQRAVGFQQASSPWVLQMDDDVFLEPDCLATLLGCMRERTAVGPTMVDDKSGLPSQFMRPRASLAHKLLFWIVNGSDGYQPGRISKSGVNMALADDGRMPYEVDWLPGGCMLQSREHLVMEAFYPFPGKAYGEDLYHCALLRAKGMQLIHCTQAVCRVDFSSNQAPGLMGFTRIMFGWWRAMFHLAKQTGASRLRFLLSLPLQIYMLVSHKIATKLGVADR